MHGRDEDKCLKTCAADTKSPFCRARCSSLEDFIDLHPFHPKDIPSVVEEYLEQCSQADSRKFESFTRRGTGVQRNIVQNICSASTGSFLPRRAAGSRRLGRNLCTAEYIETA